MACRDDMLSLLIRVFNCGVDTESELGSPRRVMVFGPCLKVIWGMAKSADMGPRVRNHARPRIRSTPVTGKIKKRNREWSLVEFDLQVRANTVAFYVVSVAYHDWKF